jgi:4-hydroxybenzoate polyprenyltransferase
VSRPVGWVLAVGLFQMGLAYGEAARSWWTYALSIHLAFPFCLLLFGLNDVVDRASDVRNPRKRNVFYGAQLSDEDASFVRRAAHLAGASFIVWVVLLPWASAALLALVLAVSVIYSVPVGPLPRLKEIPFVDGIASTAIILGLAGVGFTLGAPLSDVPPEAYACAPAIVGFHVFGTVLDEAADREAGHRTMAVRWGSRPTAVAALALCLVTLASAVILEFAPPVLFGIVVGVIGVGAHVVLPRIIAPRHVFAGVGALGTASLAYLVLIYL